MAPQNWPQFPRYPQPSFVFLEPGGGPRAWPPIPGANKSISRRWTGPIQKWLQMVGLNRGRGPLHRVLQFWYPSTSLPETRRSGKREPGLDQFGFRTSHASTLQRGRVVSKALIYYFFGSVSIGPATSGGLWHDPARGEPMWQLMS